MVLGIIYKLTIIAEKKLCVHNVMSDWLTFGLLMMFAMNDFLTKIKCAYIKENSREDKNYILKNSRYKNPRGKDKEDCNGSVDSKR